MGVAEDDIAPPRTWVSWLAAAVPLLAVPTAWLILREQHGLVALHRVTSDSVQLTTAALFALSLLVTGASVWLLGRGRQPSAAFALATALAPWVSGLVGFRLSVERGWRGVGLAPSDPRELLTGVVREALGVYSTGVALSVVSLVALGLSLAFVQLDSRRPALPCCALISMMGLLAAFAVVEPERAFIVFAHRVEELGALPRLLRNGVGGVFTATLTVLAAVTAAAASRKSSTRRQRSPVAAATFAAIALAGVGSVTMYWSTSASWSLPTGTAWCWVSVENVLTPLAAETATAESALELSWLLVSLGLLTALAIRLRRDSTGPALAEAAVALALFAALGFIDASFNQAATPFVDGTSTSQPRWKSVTNFQPIATDPRIDEGEPYLVATPMSVIGPDGVALSRPWSSSIRALVDRWSSGGVGLPTRRVLYVMPDARLSAAQVDQLVTAALDADVELLHFVGVTTAPRPPKPPLTKHPATWILQLDAPSHEMVSMPLERSRPSSAPRLPWPREQAAIEQRSSQRLGIFFDGEGSAAEFLRPLESLPPNIVLVEAGPSLERRERLKHEDDLTLGAITVDTDEPDRELLRDELRRLDGNFFACYTNDMVMVDPTEALKLSFTVGLEGSVQHASATSFDHVSKRLGECLLGVIRRHSFPAPSERPVTITAGIRLLDR